MSGLDDTFRPNVDGKNILNYIYITSYNTAQFWFNTGTPTTFEDDLPLPLAPKNQTSYDELRQKNREDHAKKNQNPFYR